MTDYRSCLRTSNPEIARIWNEICDDADQRLVAWIAYLRGQGFKAAHPNDGWVNRSVNSLQFVYPHFNDGAKAGDKVMLGWPGKQAGETEYPRAVVLTGLKTGLFTTAWNFEDAQP